MNDHKDWRIIVDTKESHVGPRCFVVDEDNSMLFESTINICQQCVYEHNSFPKMVEALNAIEDYWQSTEEQREVKHVSLVAKIIEAQKVTKENHVDN